MNTPNFERIASALLLISGLFFGLAACSDGAQPGDEPESGGDPAVESGDVASEDGATEGQARESGEGDGAAGAPGETAPAGPYFTDVAAGSAWTFGTSTA